MRAAALLVLALACAAPVVRADDEVRPLLATRPATDVVRALLEAAPRAVRRYEHELRRRGPKVASVVRAARAKATAAGRVRLDRLLGRLTLDWHRAQRPAGMVYVPAGPVETPRPRAPWGPSGKRAIVAAYYIDRTEVTVAAWRTWLAALEAREPGSVRRRRLRRPGPNVDGRLPVVRVRWSDAVAYAREARGGRLPTAAEFDRALRGSSVASYPWGEVLREGHANLRGVGPGRVQRVGAYPKGAGPFGALDLVGNVAEWSATTVAQGRSGRFPLVLGGSFADRPDASILWRGLPRMRARLGPDEASATVGFRVARDAPPLP